MSLLKHLALLPETGRQEVEQMLSLRTTIGRVVAAAVLLTALGSALPAPAAAAAGTGDVLSAVNSARSANGRGPLALQSDLSAVAQRWAAHMASTQVLAHNPRLTSQVHNWRWVGENVGYGPGTSAVSAAFMRSPAHRANILDKDYTQIGIGVVVRGDRVWITQVFRRPMGAASPSKPKADKPKADKPKAKPKADKPDAKPAAKPVVVKPKVDRPRVPVASAPVSSPAPSAADLLSRRISTAEQRVTAEPTGDVLQSALGFAEAMRTVSG
jgi:uncharacterized protein YkwD